MIELFDPRPPERRNGRVRAVECPDGRFQKSLHERRLPGEGTV